MLSTFRLQRKVGFKAMPFYRYEEKEDGAGCAHCHDGFDVLQSINAVPLAKCPECGAAVVKTPVAPSVGRSQTGLDDRAKAAGFSKLKRLGKGEYEKQY